MNKLFAVKMLDGDKWKTIWVCGAKSGEHAKQLAANELKRQMIVIQTNLNKPLNEN